MDSHSTPINIVCWKWRALSGVPTTKKLSYYTANHVNALYTMLQRHLRLPFQLFCVTDDPEGIRSEVETVPLWEQFRELGGCFVRLKCFEADFPYFRPRFFSIDLDCVIVGDVTEIFSRQEDFIVWKPAGTRLRRSALCGSLWGLTIGTHPEVVETFDPAKLAQAPSGQYLGGTDQMQFSKACPNAAAWTVQDGIYRFSGICTKARFPLNAKIIFFNGKHLPSDNVLQQQYAWIRNRYPFCEKAPLRAAPLIKVQEEERVVPELVTVVSFWWGYWPSKVEKLGRKYIDHLFSDIRRYWPEDWPLRQVLFTEHAVAGLPPEIEVKDISLVKEYCGNLKKMILYAPESELPGLVLAFDLDTVIQKSLRPLLETLKKQIEAGNWLVTCEAAYRPRKIGGSVIGFRSCPELTALLWDELRNNATRVMDETQGAERMFYRRMLPLSRVKFWGRLLPDQVVSYKMTQNRPTVLNNAAVIRFHGRPRPHETPLFDQEKKEEK